MIGCVILKQYQFGKNTLSFLEVLHVFTFLGEGDILLIDNEY